jgi:DNA-binding beta-propeller fold protein YncE
MHQAVAVPVSTREAARRAAGFLLAALLSPLLSMPCAAGDAAPVPAYHLAARYALGGTDRGYDYLLVDGPDRRLFVTHGGRVEVLDADSGARIGQIGDLAGAHGVEIVAPLHRAFVTSGVDRTVVMFDPATLQVIKRIRYLGEKPDALQYDPSSGMLFVVNGGATGDVSVIDPASGAIVDTIALGGGKLEEIAFDGRGRGFVNDEEHSVIHVIDSHTHRLVADWPLAPAEAPTGLAIDLKRHRLFAACGNGLLAIVDADSGKLLGTAAIGPEPDGAAFDPRTGRVFTSNRDATMTVVGQNAAGAYVPLQTVKTESGARTIAVDESTGRLFLPAARFGPTPAPTPAVPEPRPPLIPESFAIVVVAP